MKATSLASVIQYPEVLHNAENIYYANSRVIELLIVAGLWYLLVVSVLTPLQMLLERRFARGVSRGPADDDPPSGRDPRRGEDVRRVTRRSSACRWMCDRARFCA